MTSKVRKLAKLATRKTALDQTIGRYVDSDLVKTLAASADTLDSALTIGLIDSDYIQLRQDFVWSGVTSKPTTISGYGITNAKTKTAVDSDVNTVYTTIRSSAPSQLNTMGSIASALNNDSDFLNTFRTETLDWSAAAGKVIQGAYYGYRLGGNQGTGGPHPSPIAPPSAGPPGGANYIEKFSFTSGGNATDVGDLTYNTFNNRGVSGGYHGYAYSLGGQDHGAFISPTHAPQYNYSQNKNKIAYASDANASGAPNIGFVFSYGAATSSPYNGYGYFAGGTQGDSPTVTNNGKGPFLASSAMHRFSLVNGAEQAQVVSGMSVVDYGAGETNNPIQGGGAWGMVATASFDDAYLYGGNRYDNSTPSSSGYTGTTNLIRKFPFASDNSLTNISSGSSYQGHSSASSATHGYYSKTASPNIGGFVKFSFSSDAILGDPFSLYYKVERHGGTMSAHDAYGVGGDEISVPGGAKKHITKFPFANDASSADVGDLVNDADRIGTAQR